MSAAPSVDAVPRNPPIDYAVAVWLGMPQAEIDAGLREGWIRRGADAPRRWVEERGALSALSQADGIAQPPSPDGESSPAPGGGGSVADARQRIEGVLRSLDRSVTPETFDQVWASAGADDAARANVLIGFLADTLGVSFPESAAETSDRIATLDAAAGGASGSARFTRLDTLSTNELQALAREDGATRRALARHSSWALIGDRALAHRADPGGQFDRFDPDTGDVLLSDAWISDRARHAAWTHAKASGHSLEVPGESWRFVDRAAGDGATVELAGREDAGDVRHQVIFANDGGDRVNGNAATDRIHGGRGDDWLRGRAGDDLIEGGAGNDVVQGGSGRDMLVGQHGDDELEGGSGDDVLDGGRGDDDLAGGAGTDLLRGGAGDDVYRIESGGGHDTIDDDGGTVLIDDVAVAGVMERVGEGWRSADGRYTMSLEGSADVRELVITYSDGAEAGSSVRLGGWSNGRYGITLASIDEAPGDEDAEERPANGDRGNDVDEPDDERGEDDEISGDGANDPSTPPGDSGNPSDDGGDASASASFVDVDVSALVGSPPPRQQLVDVAALDTAARAWWATDPGLHASSTYEPSAPGIHVADWADALGSDAAADADIAAESVVPQGWQALMSSLPEPPLVAPEPLLRRST